MPEIDFDARLYNIGSWTILSLPKSASDLLPSRSMHFIEGSINRSHILAPLEPDGKGGHWLRVSDDMLKDYGLRAGDMVHLSITPSRIWPEPDLPIDLKEAFAKDQQAGQQWMQTTTIARWEWIRWIRSTKNEATRKRRIEVALDKLNNGVKRPCCFNRNMCSEPSVARNGVLLEPSPPSGTKQS